MLHKATAFVLGFCVVTAGAELQAQEPQEGTKLWRSTQFESTLGFGADARAGRAADVPARFEKITIEGFQKLTALDFPFEGLLLVQLRAGELVTIIDDERQERGLGDFWLVRPGQEMALETEDDKVILATYLIGSDYVDRVGEARIQSSYDRPGGQFEEATANLYTRVAYRVGDPQRPIAIVLDLNVGPGKRVDAYTFSGVAIVEVTSGEGTLSVGGEQIRGVLGTSFGTSAGETLGIDNRESERPLKLRAVIWRE